MLSSYTKKCPCCGIRYKICKECGRKQEAWLDYCVNCDLELEEEEA